MSAVVCVCEILYKVSNIKALTYVRHFKFLTEYKQLLLYALNYPVSLMAVIRSFL